MSQEQYESILAAVADKLKSQSNTIEYQSAEIYLLKKRLQEAETHINRKE